MNKIDLLVLFIIFIIAIIIFNINNYNIKKNVKPKPVDKPVEDINLTAEQARELASTQFNKIYLCSLEDVIYLIKTKSSKGITNLEALFFIDHYYEGNKIPESKVFELCAKIKNHLDNLNYKVQIIDNTKMKSIEEKHICILIDWKEYE